VKKTARGLAATLAGAALAIGAGALAAAPASAANTWAPFQVNDISYTPDVSRTLDLRYEYTGAATTISAVDFTVDAPAGTIFTPQTANLYAGTGGFVRVTEQDTATPTYVPCNVVSPTQLRCNGGLVNQAGTSIASNALDTGHSVLIRTKTTVTPGTNTGTVPFVGSGTITTPLGTQTAPSATLATVTFPVTVDTPVIAPAFAGIALLGAAGIGGGMFATRRKKRQTA
jgi:hypothetical protein